MLQLALEILKFVAIAIGAVSGLIGTLTETKDKTTGRPTTWGKRIVLLIVVSSLVAATTQSIETYLKGRASREERDRQDAMLGRLRDNIETTRQLHDKTERFGHDLQTQGDSLAKTATGIGETARGLKAIASAQGDVLRDTYTLTHPLRELRVHILISYPIRSAIAGLDDAWLARVRSASGKSWALLDDPIDPLNPRSDNESREFNLLKQPEFDLMLNRKATQAGGDGKYLRDHGAELHFRTTEPRTLLYIHFDAGRIDQQVYAATARLSDTQNIGSWRDLYGAELIIKLPQTAPTGSTITGCNLFFSGAADSRSIFLTLHATDRRANPFNEPFSNISYVRILGERELGPKPEIPGARIAR